MQRNRFLASLSWLILVPLAGCAHDVPTTVDVTGIEGVQVGDEVVVLGDGFITQAR